MDMAGALGQGLEETRHESSIGLPGVRPPTCILVSQRSQRVFRWGEMIRDRGDRG